MEDQQIIDQIIMLSIEQWNHTFGGISALDICDKVDVSNEYVMSQMELLCKDGKGSLNANVELYVITFNAPTHDDEKPEEIEIPGKLIKTHIFFPSKEILTEYFYTSNLVREKYPEYKNRLHQGENQLQLVFFSDELLARYFEHPEFYETEDSLAGGHIRAKYEAPENRYLYVRYGKRKLKNGRTAVTAIFKDLSVMSSAEQRHWHSYELDNEEAASHDPNFSRFLARTYEGEFVDYPNPLQEITLVLKEINEGMAKETIFKRIGNSHLRFPVENTEKAFYDCCSELYKLVGADSLDQKAIKRILSKELNVNESEFIHLETGRPLSSMQILALLESKLDRKDFFTKSIKEIGKYRIEADHKLTLALADEKNYVNFFLLLCEELVKSGKYFICGMEKVKST